MTKIWQGISEFAAVADTGSFTEAARYLDISVAQVSRNISELEARLDIKLLYRSTRRVSLTEEGTLYLQHCRNLVSSLDEANRSITNLKATPRGLIKITAPVYYGEYHLAPLLNQFLVEYPEVELDLQLTNTKLDLIQGSFDLAVRLGQLESSSLIARRLSSRTQHIVAAPDYLAQHGTPQTPAELSQHQCLLGSVDGWRILNEQGKPFLFRPQGRLRCNSGPTLLDAALRGLGLAQLPDYYVKQAVADKKLTMVLEGSRMPDDGIWAVYPQNRHLSAKVRHLVEFLVKRL
ncbi:LysR family transcriptional regulator [Aliidiomarina shirensis]|uniref:LysR family transcriptional regulator n=1 Tax=Aliidiomarina shirensis TaxID=1048642 RepID=A0A432WXP2_9GAMM|nr:LysR substrate-binding domain-containing protein [Aliidiomarina shirensis]RUO38497.1 LysR family transcriptional regulator [Aliidiomarina shirensis]